MRRLSIIMPDISSARHRPTADSERISRATERVAAGDNAFVDRAVGQLEGLQFPAFKFKILEHVKSEPEVSALFEGLDGNMEYKDAYHVRKAIEGNAPQNKTRNQITDETRINPNFQTRQGTGGAGTKEKEAVNPREERGDYPEVTPTAMSNYVCNRCGKPFQNQHDLVQHQKFESGASRDVKIPGNKNI
jgi:hypothetical protein